jgi:HSP20 family protein
MARNPLMPFRSGSGLLGGGDPFLSLHREMNRMFDDVLRGMPVGSGQGGSGQFVQAHMNVSETEKEIRITAELPGVSQDDVDVNLDDDVLTIRGEKRFEQENEKENFHFVERSYGTFQRSLRLPFPVDPEQVRATFENGVLTVTLPKSAQQERTRKIQIQGGRGGQAGGTSSGSAQAGPGGSARAAQGQSDKSTGGAKK